MLRFKEWEKEHFVYIVPGNSRAELRIHKKVVKAQIGDCKWDDTTVYKSCLEEKSVLSFEEAFRLAKDEGKKFWPSDEISCYKIYFELQDELDRIPQEYPHLYIKYIETKPYLICPAPQDDRLQKQYDICNALFGYKNAYEKLPEETKGCLEDLREFCENVLNN